jgi:protease-4
MSLETETVLDRRRLRRQIAFWRIFALIAIVAAVGTFAVVKQSDLGLERRQIARVAIEGMITDDRDLTRLLRRISEAKHVEGVILAVNSPGGTTTGGEALFEGLRRLAERKPIVAQFGTVAASAAYIAGLGTDHIVARGNSITGSVGVIVQWPEVAGLLDKIGVRMNEVKSGPLKATPSPFQPIDERGRALTQEMVAESQRWFLSLVSDRRGIDPTTVPGLTDGRIYSGREAVKLKLVDELGGEQEAVRWLVKQRGVSERAKVVDWKPERGDDWSFGASVASLAGHLASGFVTGLKSAVRHEAGLGATGLDGLLSVWQPSEK